MTWLDEHSSAIQALAGVASLLVTAVLAALTARYVRLTGEIATAAREQSRQLGEANRKAVELADSSLRAHAMRLRASLEGLNRSAPQDQELRHFSLINSHHVDTLETLARSTGDGPKLHAILATMALHTIVGMTDRVRGVAANYGYAFTEGERTEYVTALKEAIDALEAIGGVADAVEAV